MDEIDELLGTRRSYGWNSGSRPSMISAKYRLKEERRKVLKISVNKMKKIDDAESSLCRSVLINNTVKRLQAETRDDRTTGRTSPASPPSPTSVGYGYHGGQPLQTQPCPGGGGNPQLVDITNLRESPACNGGNNNNGVSVGVTSVGKTLQTNNNNNNVNNNNNTTTNNKSLTAASSDTLQSSSLLTVDQQHQLHHHHHLHHLHHHHHHQQHHHHQHHQQQQQQQLQSSSALTTLHHHHQQQQHPQQHHHHHHHHQPSSYDDYDDDDDDADDDDDDDDAAVVDDDEDDTIASIMMQLPSSTTSAAGGRRKRSRTADVQQQQQDEPLDDLLSQFIGGQREDEDVNVVDLDLHEYPAAKRLRTDEAAAAAAAAAAVQATSCSSSSPSAAASVSATAADLCSSDCWSLMDTCCDDSTLDLYGGQVPAAVEHQDVLLPAVVTAQSVAAASVADCCPLSLQQSCSSPSSQDEHYAGSTSPTSLSCGQASMFSEMQSAMFRNLIASLES